MPIPISSVIQTVLSYSMTPTLYLPEVISNKIQTVNTSHATKMQPASKYYMVAHSHHLCPHQLLHFHPYDAPLILICHCNELDFQVLMIDIHSSPAKLPNGTLKNGV